MDNKEELRITITSIILATGLAVVAFTDWDMFYHYLFGIPAVFAFLYLLAVASSLRYADVLIFPIPLLFFSIKSRMFLYNTTIDVFIGSGLSMVFGFFKQSNWVVACYLFCNYCYSIIFNQIT